MCANQNLGSMMQQKKIMTVRELLSRLNEMPYLYSAEFPLKNLGHISDNSVTEHYKKIGMLPIEGDLVVYLNTVSKAYMVGQHIGGQFFIYLSLSRKQTIEPVVPAQLSNDYFQVSMVNVDAKQAMSGVARAFYTFIAAHYDIISDQEQFKCAKSLWNSLARNDIVNVYVFDCAKRDYYRDDKGVIVKYNGQNIPENQIWGQTQHHYKMLLVATTKELK